MKLILYGFEFVSGLTINFKKSSVMVLGGDRDRQPSLAANLNCAEGSFPITYLDIPLRPSKLLRDDWIPLIDIFERRMASWKSRV